MLLLAAACALGPAVAASEPSKSPAKPQKREAAAPAATPARPADTPAYDYREHTLSNGLNVITLEDFSCPIVAVQLWYHVGSKDERPDRQGFAHMFEHMMFRGTDILGPTDHFDFIRRTGGTTNAYTSFDMTVYHEIVPADQLELALWLEAERMACLTIDQEAFDTERKVVEEERRLGLNQPYGTLYEDLLKELFHVHPYRWSPIGKIPHLRAATVGELRSFWQRYYIPNNATLVIVGAVKHEDAQRLAERYFGWIPRREAPPRIGVREPVPTEKRNVVIRQKIAPAPIVGFAFHTVPTSHADHVPLTLLARILGQGRSSRLYRELVAERQLAVEVMAMGFDLEQAGVLGMGAVLPPVGGKPDEVMALMEAQAERLRNEPVSREELLKAKNQMLRGLVTEQLTIANKARSLGRAAVAEGDVGRVNHELERIRQATAEDILRVAKTYLAPDRCLEVRVPRNLLGGLLGGLGKKDEQDKSAKPSEAKPEKAEPESEKKLQRPEDFPSKPPLTHLPAVKSRVKYSPDVLPNGLKVIVIPNHEVPFVSFRLGLLAGSWAETKPGTASMALEMLTKGTARHTEAELSEELETYAVSLSGDAGSDSASVSGGCLTEQLGRAMDLMAEVVLEPTFPEDEFRKLQKQVRTGLEVSAKEPSHLAGLELDRRLYGDHPYARPVTGLLAEVDKLTPDDLRTWWGQFARPDMAVLIFAGDVDRDRALQLAGKALGDWKAEGERPKVDLPALPKPSPTHIYLVDRPGSVQSQIRVAQLGFDRHDPGYFTSRAVSDYFGGSFSSRLNESIRVKKGLTYGARGGYGSQRFGGAFTASTFTKTKSTADAVRAVLEEIDRLADDPPTAKELETIQAYYLGSFARQRETPQQVAGQVWLIQSDGLPADHFEAMVDAIRKTTPEQCVSLVRKTIDPKKMVIVVVGDAKQLKKDLEEIAPVTVVQPQT